MQVAACGSVIITMITVTVWTTPSACTSMYEHMCVNLHRIGLNPVELLEMHGKKEHLQLFVEGPEEITFSGGCSATTGLQACSALKKT